MQRGREMAERQLIIGGLMLLYAAAGCAQEFSQFHCIPFPEPNQGNQVFTPNIPDVYFNPGDVNAFAAGSGRTVALTGARERTTNVFVIPAFSEDRNCSGTIVALQHCYRANNTVIGSRQNVFDFLVLREEGQWFNVSRSLSVYSTPRSNICFMRSSVSFCCDQFNFSVNDQIQLPLQNFTYGVVYRSSDTRRLRFRSLPQYIAENYYFARPSEVNLAPGGVFRMNPSSNRTLLLLRFVIEPEPITEPPPTTTEPESTDLLSSAPSTPLATPTITTVPPFTTPANITTTTIVTSAEPDTTESQTSESSMELITTETTSEPDTTESQTSESSMELITTETTSEPDTTESQTSESSMEPITTETTTEFQTSEPSTELVTAETTTELETSEPSSTGETSTAEFQTSMEPVTTETMTEPGTTGSQTSESSTELQITEASTETIPGEMTTILLEASSPAASLMLAPLVGGVAGGAVIIGALLFAVVVCLIVVIRRKGKLKTYDLDTPRNVFGITNMIYDAGAGHQLSSLNCSLSNGDHLYSLVNRKSKETSLVENEYAYAEASTITKSNNSNNETDASAAYDQVPSYDSLHHVIQKTNAQETAGEEKEDGEDIYMVPAMDEEGLYTQLDNNKTQTLSRECLKFGEELGSGQFGVVYKGVWHSSKGDVEVAVKTLREGAEKEDKVKFLQEAAIMGQFKHCNVVAMHGVITTGEPILIVLELLLKGDLKKHLLQFHFTEGEVLDIDDHTLLSYCRQVASGMTYLSNKAFVHRDLAARNILVSDDDTCKIADFGMSRDLMDETYYVSHGGKIPVKWTAPEALHYKKYSTASDVWSYGVLMYEIWSLGLKPYKDITNEKALKIVDTGYRLPPPPGCPRALYNIMIHCWHPETSHRPVFPEISRQLSLPDSKLLKWSEEDKAVHPEAAKLGADLLSAQELYKDLQVTYDS